MPLTEVGRILRQIRFDNSELLKDMAKKLGIGSAKLSAIETGREKLRLYWVTKIIKNYEISEEFKDKLIAVGLKNALSSK